MPTKSASTLIYFFESKRKKSLKKKPKHINKEKRTRYIKLGFMWVVLFLMSGAGCWWYIKFHPLNVTSVKIEGAQRFVNPADVQKITQEQVINKNILFLDSRTVEKTVSGNFLAAKSVKLIRVFPNTIKVSISERIPIALILPAKASQGDNEQNFYFVDSDGFVLGKADKSATNLPIINYGRNVEVGKFVEPGTVSYYFDLIKALDSDGVYASTISSYPRYTEFYTTDKIQVLFTNEQSARSQVAIYAKLIEAFKAQGKGVKKIDLRFDKVIVEFIKTP